jgi:uncharacterized integral membrane protein (TIGR00698 family)
VVAVVLGALAANLTGINRGPTGAALRPGLRFANRTLLRAGVVLLGLRLSLTDVRDLGGPTLLAVVLVVAATFFGTRWLGARFGLSPGFALLVATGFSICGASAIAAAEPFSDATEEELAYALSLVTLCGTLAIFVLPPLGALLGLPDEVFGAWVGASVHDVGQVVAAASTHGSVALRAAVVVKLTRVVLLAPIVTGLALTRKRRCADTPTTDVSPLPLFVVLFLVAVVARTVLDIPAATLDAAEQLETWLLGAGLFALGCGVDLSRLRRLGGRPLALGLASWAMIAALGLASAQI